MIGRRRGKNRSQDSGFRIQVTSIRARGMLNYELNCLPPPAYCRLLGAFEEPQVRRAGPALPLPTACCLLPPARCRTKQVVPLAAKRCKMTPTV